MVAAVGCGCSCRGFGKAEIQPTPFLRAPQTSQLEEQCTRFSSLACASSKISGETVKLGCSLRGWNVLVTVFKEQNQTILKFRGSNKDPTNSPHNHWGKRKMGDVIFPKFNDYKAEVRKMLQSHRSVGQN